MFDSSIGRIRLLGLLLIVAAAWVAIGPVGAQQTPQQSRLADKTLGEEEQIRQRSEWFFSSRREGVASNEEMWRLRLSAVEQTREALERQALRRTTGEESGQNVWVEMGPSPSRFGGWTFGNVSGRIQAIAADWEGGVLYVGATAGGVWKSINDGLSWTPLLDSAGSLSVGAISIDPDNPDVLWVGTGDNIVGCESYFGIGMLRSADGGATWELRNGSAGNTLEELAGFAGIAIDPRDTNRIVTGGKYRGCASGSQQTGGIFSTDDGGATWTERLADREIYEILRDPVVPDILWASTHRGPYKSVDNGVTWNQQHGDGLPTGQVGRNEIAISPTEPNTVYVLFDNPADQFWRTGNGGINWTMMNGDACEGQCWYNMTIRVDPFDRNIIYRGTVKIYKSLNAGLGWTQLTNNWGSTQQVHQDTHALLMHPTQPGTFYVAGDGGLWKSENGGSTFTNLNGNLNVTQFYAIDVDANDPGRICGGAQDNSSLATEGNVVWDLQAVTGDGFVCLIDPVDPDFAYITSYPSGGYPSVSRSAGGLFGNFFKITGSGSGVNAGDRSNWVTPYALDPSSPNILFLGTHRMYRSTNRGSFWTPVGPADLSGGGGATLTVIEVNRNFTSSVWTGSNAGKIWRSTNNGSDWGDISTGLPGRGINDIAGDPTDADRALAVVGGFNVEHLWEWTSETGWEPSGSNLPNVPANTVLMLTGTDILVGTDTGIFRSQDGGQTFLPFMAGLPQGVVVTDLKYNVLQNRVTAGTYARGAWQTTLGPPQPILLAEWVEQPMGELDGDADGKIEPGETWSVRPILRNAGGVTAADVTARLATSTPGVTILAPDSVGFGSLDPGSATPSLAAIRFTVDPSFACGNQIEFDLVDIVSTSPAESYDDQTDFFTAAVQTQTGDPIVTKLIDEDFESAPDGWTHEAITSSSGQCLFVTHLDEWNLATKDAAHGTSFHCGNGPGGSYGINHAWLYPSGKDSENGVGFVIPEEAFAARLRLVHWYDTTAGHDGGQVAIDVVEDDQDEFTTLDPVDDYPGTLAPGNCNLLGGRETFQGSSGGWVESFFDLTEYKGSRVYLAFIFGSDQDPATEEGWYIDEVEVEYQTEGPQVCDVTLWPGIVPDAQLELIDADTIEATWTDACNVGELPGQTYSIQAGDLDALFSNGTYTHAPVGGACDLTSSSSFTPGPGNEYYVIVPAAGGREGGAGSSSSGAERPQPGNVCGEQRVATCPSE